MAVYLATVIVVFAIVFDHGAAIPRQTITNEDIRDAILQVVNMVRSTEDKLERHEYRERLLGDNLKKGMISIDKRIKLLDPFKGTISRLDQRLAAVETYLMQNDDRRRIQLEKTYQTVEDISKNLPLLVDKLKYNVEEKLTATKPVATISKDDLDKFEKTLTNKLEEVTSALTKDLAQIKQNDKELSKKSSENFDKVKRQLNTSEQLLEKYENKLAEYNNKIPEIPQTNQKDLQGNILAALDIQKGSVEQILSDVKMINSKLDKNETKQDVVGEIVKKLDNTEQVKALEGLKKGIGELTDKFSTSYNGIRAEMENLAKVEQVMVQTADVVLDTRRRVEYGTHQVISEVKEMVKKSSKDVDDAISERFDTFEMSILDSENGALANLTSKIGNEIDQVWRQIGIMHQQMSASTDTLNDLKNQTDAYVNGSLNVMDNMKGKVGTITSRIIEVDDNLNYLMGKLSLVTQEFNQIKAGLGKALEEMKDTYKTVKNKVNESGGDEPRRIKIDDDDETGN